MTADQFNLVVASTGMHQDSATYQACHAVLVLGMRRAEAARQFGINQSNITRALRKIPMAICKCCGQPIK